MKFLCSALCGILVLLHCAEGVYQPECDSLDGAIDQIQQSIAGIKTVQGLGSTTINCTKKPDCDGFTCIMGIQQHTTVITVELKPCEEPPQMFLLMQSEDSTQPFIEQTVTHGDSFPIPGMEIAYQFFRMQAALGVQFQNVSNGLSIGLSLDLYVGQSKISSVPLLPPTVIAVPECTSTDVGDQCTHMQTLVASLTPAHDFQCIMNPDCKGFSCSGDIETTFGVTLNAKATLVIDSCTNPVSYNISVGPRYQPPSDNRVFSGSGNQQLVLPDLPRGVTADLNLTMIPCSQNIDYIRTTIAVIFCYPGIDCVNEVFIENALVPIPPCDNPVPPSPSGSNASLTPFPGTGNECTTWTDIATDIQNNDFLEPGSMICHHNGPCDGVVCTINSSHDEYKITIKLFHCETPIRIHVVIEGKGSDVFHREQDVYHDDTISINEIVHDSSLKFHLVKRASDEVELALSLKLQESSLYQQSVYLIKDRLIPIAPCPMTPPSENQSSTAMMTTMGMGQKTGRPKPNVTTKKPNKKNPKDQNNDKKDPKKNQQSNAVTIAVVVGIAGLVAVVVIILVGAWYYRRNSTTNDHVALMENSSAAI